MFFSKLYAAIEDIKRQIGEAISTNAALERRHAEEIMRLLHQHSREIDTLKEQAANLANLNERLLVQCGLTPLDHPSSETKSQNTPSPQETSSIAASLIQRDKKRVRSTFEADFQARLQSWQVERAQDEIPQESSPDN